MTPNQYDQSQLDRRFDKESKDWKTLYEPVNKSLFKYHNKKYRQEYALELLGNGSGKVLDLGCGSGSFFEPLEKLGYQVIGLDPASNMVELAALEARKLKNSRVIQGNALQLPFAANTFDGLLAVGLLEYLPSDEEFLEKIKRVMKPGGRIVLTLRNALCLERILWKCFQKLGLSKYQVNYYYREHNPKEFEAILVSMGFQNIQKRFCHFYPFPWPLNRLLGPLNAFLAHQMENWFSKNGSINFLGSTYLVAFNVSNHKPPEREPEHKSLSHLKVGDLLDYIICPQTGQALNNINPEMLEELNIKIPKGELANQKKEKIRERLEDALITTDGKLVYPIKNQVPILLTEEAIFLKY